MSTHKSKNILVTGISGQVGWELVRSCSLLGNVTGMTHRDLDLTSEKQIQDTLRRLKPDILINAAAYTAVDKAESESELCYQINANAVRVFAEECKKLNSTFVHFSTDYVFDGQKKSPYVETDLVGPQNVYGKSKLEGESQIQSIDGDFFIFRVSWVYSHRGQNFLKTMLRLASQRPELKVVSDQMGVPTWARFISEAVAHVLGIPHYRERKGLYHLVPHGQTHWCEFAQKILVLAQKYEHLNEVIPVLPIPSSQYPTPAFRPLNSRMSNQHFINTFNLPLQDWERYLELCITSL